MNGAAPLGNQAPLRFARRAAAAALFGARLAAAVTVVTKVARAARRAPPLAPAPTQRPTRGSGGISVVIPARDEATRLGPCLVGLRDAPGVIEVIVVDDESADGTAAVAADFGATVLAGAPLPAGWAGKCWALQQGIDAARGEWIVTLDADARPSAALPEAVVERMAAEGIDLATVGGRFDCPTAGARWLHPALLTTLVYRFGPPGVERGSRERVLANGQCTAMRREPFLASGGFGSVREHLVEDVALARHLAAQGWRVALLDGADVVTVRMFETVRETWTGWGRSLALPGVESPQRQTLDVAIVTLAQALPLPRVLVRRGDALDAALLLVRIGTLFGTRRAYERVTAAYWLSPLADLPAAVRLAWSIARPSRRWRGRSYG
ncbi:MAG: glycosyltransferase family 2 protein [Acidimicrobiia bacterium]